MNFWDIASAGIIAFVLIYGVKAVADIGLMTRWISTHEELGEAVWNKRYVESDLKKSQEHLKFSESKLYESRLKIQDLETQLKVATMKKEKAK